MSKKIEKNYPISLGNVLYVGLSGLDASEALQLTGEIWPLLITEAGSDEVIMPAPTP